MYSINPRNQSTQENYKIMTGAIIPRPIAFVTSMSEEGIVNAAPFSYFNIVSANPPLISVSVQRKNGEMKDTAKNILSKKQFVVHLTTEQNVSDINKTAAPLPFNESELLRTDLTLVDSEAIDVPGIEQSSFRMECEFVQHVENETYNSFDLLIGKVVRFHIDENSYDAEKGYVDEASLQAVSRLAGNSYAKVGDMFEIERPTK